jgi:PAS domain S-box-containing protein
MDREPRMQDDHRLLDALPESLAVLDPEGTIQGVNSAWNLFARENGVSNLERVGCGVDYLAVCRRSALAGCVGAREALSGLQDILEGRSEECTLEYPCHSPNTERWFLMRASRLPVGGAVVLHIDITGRKHFEQAIRESEERFRLMAETIEDVFWMSTPGIEEMLYVSPAYERMWGRTRESLYRSPHSFIESIHPEDRDRIMDHVQEHARGVWEAEYRIMRPDGSVRWIHDRGFPILGEQGVIRFMTGVARDITEHKQLTAEILKAKEDLEYRVLEQTQAFKQSEEKYRDLVENANSIIIRTDGEGRILFCNGFGCTFFGFAQDELTGRSIFDTILPKRDSSGRDLMAMAEEMRANPERFVNNENENVRKDGARVWVSWTNKAIYNAEGRFCGLLAIGQDVTERRDAEEALRRSEKRFRDLVESSPTAIAIYQDDELIFRNPEHERLMGQLLSSPMKATLANVHPDDLERVKELDRQFKRGNTSSLDAAIRVYPYAKIGSISDLKWIHFSVSHIEYNGEQAFMVNAVDMTRMKELEHLATTQHKMSILGRVSAGIAHEIRNPLGGLNMYMSALKDVIQGVDHPEMQLALEIIGKMQAASNRVEAVVRKVLDFSRPTTPKLSPIDINQPVEDAASFGATTIRKGGVRLEMSLTRGLPPCHADSQLLQHVILNLIANAVEAMKSASDQKVLAISTAAEDGHVIMKVSDSGPGIPETMRGRVFEPFFSTSSDGLGIGLCLSSRIIMDHGGTIDVSESRWGGCEFRIALPLAGEMTGHDAT